MFDTYGIQSPKSHLFSLEVLEHAPQCLECGADRLKPDSIYFGEPLEPRFLKEAEVAAAEADVVLMIGTLGTVDPAAGIPVMAKEHGAVCIEINPIETELTRLADVVIRAQGGAAMPELLR